MRTAGALVLLAALVVLVRPVGAPAGEAHRLACNGPPTIDSLTETASTSTSITLTYLWTTSSATGNTFDLTVASQDVNGSNYPSTGQWNGSHVFTNLAAATSYPATMTVSNPCGKASKTIQAATGSTGTSTSTTTATTTSTSSSGEPELDISFAGAGTGSVFLSWTRQASGSIGEECPSSDRTCSFPLAAGTSVTLQARPAAGSSFAGWSPTTGCAGTSCTLTLRSTQTYQATFAAGSSTTTTTTGGSVRHELTVLVVGAGNGTVVASWTRQSTGSIGEVCTRRDARCGFGLVSTTRVRLVARPAAGSRFVSWRPTTGCDAYACSFSILGAGLTYTADFALLPRCRPGVRSTHAHPCRPR